MHILLVDDMPVIGQIINPVIESFQRKLIVATTPQAAFQYLAAYEGQIDLILLDWHLPMMSGIDILRKLKESDTWKDIPVIMLTSNLSKTAIAQAFSSGCSHYMIKPFKNEELMVRIQDVYEKVYRKKNIMVVDDSNLIITLLSRILNKMNYQVSCVAHDGHEALELYQQHRPSLVFLDLNMPKMDGIQALEALRNLNPNAKIICMTSNQRQELEDHILNAGAIALLRKPFDDQKVLETLVDAFS